MSSLKIYIHFEESGYPEKTSKIQIPKSWNSKEVKDVIGLFTTAYNAKNPSQVIDLDNVHLVLDGNKIYSNDVVSEVLSDRLDYYIKFGTHLKTVAKIEEDVNKLRCRNLGCNQFYYEEENFEGACSYHTAPPRFHDTIKCWSCCPDKKAYDFDSFKLIAGCANGRHSDVLRQVLIAESPNSNNNISSPQPVVLSSIADYNTKNPDAVSAASTAVKITTTRKSTRNNDGTAKCLRKGCQKTFVVAENHAEACTYHGGQPVFHDAVKIWSCCPDKKCYDFDEFLAVPGCAIGSHDDGEDEQKA
eukprot:gene15179-20446_t